MGNCDTPAKKRNDCFLPISVVVCNRNRAQLLDTCLRSVATNEPMEVIVVDGQSSDDSVAVARRHGAIVVDDEGRGLGYARRLGIRTATQPYVFFLDTDVTLPSPDALRSMLDELRSTDVTGLHAQVFGDQVTNYWEWAQDAHFCLTFNYPGSRDAIGCVAALFRRDVLLAFPPDPYFTGASEDGDMSRRLRTAGYRLAVSRCGVLHSHRADFRQFVHQRLWYGRGNGRLAWRHRKPWLLGTPLAFLIGGSILAFRARMPQLIPYLIAHTLCVVPTGCAEYLLLAWRAIGDKLWPSAVSG